jgi:5'-nucleotidase
MGGSWNRRQFIRAGAIASGGLYAGGIKAAGELLRRDAVKLTILYTNDTHSRIEPFSANDPQYAGMGGIAARACMIEQIRKAEEHVLLLDAGDIFQGTAYFNYFHGETDYRLMSMMRYDATTFGNHDFDLGCGNIAMQMKHASFDFINCNYNLSDTELAKNSRISPYKVYRKGRLKIGVTGVGIDLKNLVAAKNSKGVLYNDPVASLNRITRILRQDLRCDYIICLSHLGYKYADKKISDMALAEMTKDIDLIIGGHTHTFLENAVSVKNADGLEVLITQAGWGGIWLGICEIVFSENNIKVFHRDDNLGINSSK